MKSVQFAAALSLILVAGCDSKSDAPASFSDRSYSGVHECDTLAADPVDPSRAEGSGIAMDKIDAAKAIEVCTKAAYEYGQTIRFRYQTGRAMISSGRDYDAVEWISGAASEEYAAAYKALATLYFDFAITTFDRVEDLQISLALLDAASTAGYPVDDEETFKFSQELYYFWFTEDGYTKPDIFKRVYDGTITSKNIRENKDLEEFIVQTYFTRLAYCADEKPNKELSMEQVMLPFIKIASSRSAQTNYDKGSQVFIAMLGMNSMQKWIEDHIDDPDMILFMARHGCSSSVANKFLVNLEERIADIAAEGRKTEYYKIIEPQINAIKLLFK